MTQRYMHLRQYMKKIILFSYYLLISTLLSAQVTDDFSDGDFSNNPSWQGNTDEFIINAAQELQLFAPDAGNSGLFLPVSLPDSTVWELQFRLEFEPSTSNLLNIVLQSGDININNGPGYFIQVGAAGAVDAIQLYRRDNSTSTTLLASAAEGAVATDPAMAAVRIVRTPAGEWQLFTDYTLSGSYTLEASFNDNTYPAGSLSYFGFYCLYTATRKDKFYFDNLAISGTNIPDNIPPVMTGVTAISPTAVDVQFDEVLEANSAETESHYFINNSIGNPSIAVLDASNPTLVHLTLDAPLTPGELYNLLSNGISDLDLNVSGDQEITFSYFQLEAAVPFDILINEILADPDPVVGLPAAEYLEIFNRSDKGIQLEGFVLSDGTTNGSFPAFILEPGAYAIVCDDLSAALFAGLGDIIPLTSFPSLNNTGDALTLSDADGITIHSVNYDLTWYNDEQKAAGGWSLELIYPNRPCIGNAQNWTASTASAGGTPGAPNSVLDNSPGSETLTLISVEVIDPSTIIVHFSQALDAGIASQTSLYNIDQGIGMPSNAFISGDFQSVTLIFTNPMSGNGFFTLTVLGITDCAGNTLSGNNTISFTLPEPELLSAESTSATMVDVYFAEPLDPASVSAADFSIDNSIGTAAAASVDGADPALVHLTFSNTLQNGVTYLLTVANVSNLAGTILTEASVSFFYYIPVAIAPYDIIINEIYPDPTPSLGLPEAEYIELYNRSEKVISLEGMLLSSGETVPPVLPAVLLLPGSYVVVYKDLPGISFGNLGDTIALESFVTLSNESDEIFLSTAAGEIIDIVRYDLSWYGSTSKQDGGWSLERISPARPCDGAQNWIASENGSGGTPGQPNSVLSNDTDTGGPRPYTVFPVATDTVLLRFNEALSAATAVLSSNYSLDPFVGISYVVFDQGTPDFVKIVLATPLQPNTTYTLTVNNALEDCLGNPVAGVFSLRLALPEPIAAGDLLINEVLFDPATGGSRFIELFNHSGKVVNTGDLNIASIDELSLQVSPVQTDFLLFPGEYIAFTENPADILSRYNTPFPENVLDNDLPTLASDTGNITIYTKYLPDPVTVDVFDYSDNLHNPLLSDKEGVSLERLSAIIDTQSPGNWHSAAANVGYATPAYENSQALGDSLLQDDFLTLLPDIFSPDEDGFDDVLAIHYSLDKPGYLAQVRVFDSRGRLIKILSNNELLSTEGLLQWKGDTDNNEKAAVGIYILLADLTHPDGDIKMTKKTCVLATRL